MTTFNGWAAHIIGGPLQRMAFDTGQVACFDDSPLRAILY